LGPLVGGEESVWHSEHPSLDPLWDASRELQRRVVARGGRTMLMGHWADQILFDDAYLGDLITQFRWRKVWHDIQEYNRWFTDAAPRFYRDQAILSLLRFFVPSVLQPPLKRWRRKRAMAENTPLWFSARWREQAAKPLSNAVEFRRQDSTAHATGLYRIVRGRYFNLCMEWNDKVGALCGARMLFPYLDRELVQFLMSIPGEMQTFEGVPKAIHRKGLRGVMPDATCDRRWKADFSHQANAGMASDYATIVNEFSQRRLVVEFGYVNDQVLTSALESARERVDRLKGESRAAWSLADLISLEWWLRLYFDPGGQPYHDPVAEPAAAAVRSTN
jgi:asparagine synthase (glutamine-hydrolysing)